jgi:hypothetical protein
MYEVEPRYQMLMNQYPSESAIMEQLNQANQEPEGQVAGPLLSAGLGAGIGFGATSLPMYFNERERNLERANKAVENFAKANDLGAKEKLVNSKLRSMFNPVESMLAKEDLATKGAKIGDFVDKATDSGMLHQKGIKKLMRSPGKLAAGTAAGAGLGLLANQIYKKYKENQGE